MPVRARRRRGSQAGAGWPGYHHPGIDLRAGGPELRPAALPHVEGWRHAAVTPTRWSMSSTCCGGRARIGIGAETYEVGAGDVVFIPEGAIHFYENTGDEPFEFLCIIPNKDDKVTIVDAASC